MSDDFFASTVDGSFPEDHVFTVSELTDLIRELLENVFARVTVVGEIADLTVAKSGHCYFTLKDEQAQLPTVIWRSYRERLAFQLQDGIEVLCRGRLDVYPPHGRYQLIVEEIEVGGLGLRELALRRLKERLAKEGLFDAARKRPLPRFPRRIGVVTSPTGAAIHDFLTALKGRLRAVDVLVVPVRVQGEGAADEIVQALQWLNTFDWGVDVIVITRGGGSAEDLSAFNDERVVRAVAASRIPTVSAVGHEIDVTLVDLAADVRALTPTDAAHKVLPSQEELEAVLQRIAVRLQGSLRLRWESAKARLEALCLRPVLRFPKDMIYDRGQRLDDKERALDHAMARCLERAHLLVNTMAGRLDSLSPLAVLSRGYSITFTHPEGLLIRDARILSPGQLVQTRLAFGGLVSRVETISENGQLMEPADRT